MWSVVVSCGFEVSLHWGQGWNGVFTGTSAIFILWVFRQRIRCYSRFILSHSPLHRPALGAVVLDPSVHCLPPPRRVIIFNVVIRADAITAFNHTCERVKTSSLRLASGQRVW